MNIASQKWKLWFRRENICWKADKMMNSPLEISVRTNKLLDQILAVDNGSKQYSLRCTAVLVVQTPVLCKIMWLISLCSYFNTGEKLRSRSYEWFAVEKWFKFSDQKKNEV
jgi:hypothetical protein